MQSEEPSACLVDAFGDEIGRINLAVVEDFLVLERIMNLSIRHRAGIEPYVDQVGLALHRLTAFGNQNHIIHIRTVQVDLFVVLLRIFARLEFQFLIRVGLHQPGFYGFLNFIVQFFNRTDADFFRPVFGTPDRQRRSPVATTAQVPVLKVFQPFAETSRTGALRFPVDRIVQFNHPFAASGRADKPAIQRIVQHRLVRTPTMRIVVHMLLDAEHTVLCFQHHADFNIQRFVFFAFGRIISVLHELALPRVVVGRIHICLHIFGVKVFQQIIFTRHINHRTLVAILVDQHQRRHAIGFCHTIVIGTERRSNMYDTCTIFCGDKVAGNHTESTFTGVHPRSQLFIFHAVQFSTFPFGNDFERN